MISTLTFLPHAGSDAVQAAVNAHDPISADVVGGMQAAPTSLGTLTELAIEVLAVLGAFAWISALLVLAAGDTRYAVRSLRRRRRHAQAPERSPR